MDKRVNNATLTPIGSELEVEVSVEIGEDGTMVVWIDTPELPENDKGPVLRVYLNDCDCEDGGIYENPPYASWARARAEEEANGKG